MNEEIPEQQSTSNDIQDALEMLGKGYEHPSLEIHYSETVIKRRGKKLIEEVIPAFVKLSTGFKSELPRIEANALKVWIFIALSINRNTEQAHPGIRTIASGCGLDKDTVFRAIKRLEELELLIVVRGKKKFNIYEIPEYVSANQKNIVPTMGTDDEESVPILTKSVPIEVKSVPASWGHNQNNQINHIDVENEKKSLLENASLEWLIESGASKEEIEKLQKTESLKKEATDAFEKALAFNPLPWWSGSKWNKLGRFVIEEYQKDSTIFKKFADLRKSEGQYTRLPSNPKIYQNPELLIAIWPSIAFQDELPVLKRPDFLDEDESKYVPR